MKTLALAFVAFGSVVGCFPVDPEAFADRFGEPGDRAFSMEYLRWIADGDLDTAFALLTPELRTSEARAQMELVRDVLAVVDLNDAVMIAANFSNTFDGSRRVNLSYEVPTDTGSTTMNVAVRLIDELRRVEGFSAYQIPVPLATLHEFTWRDKGALNVIWVLLLLTMFVACVGLAVMVVRTKGMPRRWAWALACLVAGPVWTLNWTTGAVDFRLFQVVFFGAGAMRGAVVAPWILSFGIPVGGLVAYLRRRSWLESNDEQTLDENAAV